MNRPQLADLHAATLPLALAVAACAVELAGEPARQALRWQRDALAAGELWRILSGNLAHLGWPHLLLNLTGLALVWALIGSSLQGWRGWSVLTSSALGVGLGLWWGVPSLGWYVGLSGVLHGLLVAGALAAASRRPVESWTLLGLVATKLIWESLLGPLPGTAAVAGGPVITAAHLYGAIGGLLAALAIWPRWWLTRSV